MGLRAVVAGLAVDVYVHWNLARRFDTLTGRASPHISPGQVFRVEAVLALAAIVLVLLVRRRMSMAVAALLVAAGGWPRCWCTATSTSALSAHYRTCTTELVCGEDNQRRGRGCRRDSSTDPLVPADRDRPCWQLSAIRPTRPSAEPGNGADERMVSWPLDRICPVLFTAGCEKGRTTGTAGCSRCERGRLVAAATLSDAARLADLYLARQALLACTASRPRSGHR